MSCWAALCRLCGVCTACPFILSDMVRSKEVKQMITKCSLSARRPPFGGAQCFLKAFVDSRAALRASAPLQATRESVGQSHQLGSFLQLLEGSFSPPELARCCIAASTTQVTDEGFNKAVRHIDRKSFDIKYTLLCIFVQISPRHSSRSWQVRCQAKPC